MSIAGDILTTAIERAKLVADRHAVRVDEVSQKFGDHIGRPWKFKLDAIRESREIAEAKPAAEAEE